MTIQEAIKSGKPFKRKVWDCWYDFIRNEHKGVYVVCKDDIKYLKTEDILADDWEVKEEDLLPCPFCGREVKIVEVATFLYTIEHIKKDYFEQIDCPIYRIDCLPKEKLIALWNRRINNDK